MQKTPTKVQSSESSPTKPSPSSAAAKQPSKRRKFVESPENVREAAMGDASSETILKAIGKLSTKMESEMGKIGSKVDRVEQKVDDLNADFAQKFDDIHERVTDTNEKVEKNADDITNIKWQLNELQQANLAARMEITGVEEARVTGDIKSVALSVIRSFRIPIRDAEITAAFARKPKGFDKPIITAIFATADLKSKVMKTKLAKKEATTIYFDHAMTPETRTIFKRAKVMAKTTGARTVFISGGKVVVAYEGAKKIWITEADIAGYELPEKRAVEPASDDDAMPT